MIAACRQSAHLETDVVFADAVGKCIKDIVIHNKGNLIILISDVHINISHGAVGFHIFECALGNAVFSQFNAKGCRFCIIFQIEIYTGFCWREI